MSEEKPVVSCQQTIVFGDDDGDNDCTFYCELREGHKGPHQEEGGQYGKHFRMIWKRGTLEVPR